MVGYQGQFGASTAELPGHGHSVITGDHTQTARSPLSAVRPPSVLTIIRNLYTLSASPAGPYTVLLAPAVFWRFLA